MAVALAFLVVLAGTVVLVWWHGEQSEAARERAAELDAREAIIADLESRIGRAEIQRAWERASRAAHPSNTDGSAS